MNRSSIWLVGAGLAVVVAAAGGVFVWNARHAKVVAYITAPVDRGSIQRTITASGSVNPEVTVQVGAFVSGTIKDMICDYNSTVTKGQVCARIDPRPYQLTVDQDRAALESAKAQLVKDQAGLQYATLAHQRYALLLSQDSTSRDSVDSALSLRNQARAQVAFDQATIRQRQAALNGAEVNLGYTDIVSPVDGTVVSRNVTVGQTVASSFQTPTLFLIAKDLARMQVDTNVSESDISGAAVGARASFTVEAFPGRVFRAQVAQVRQAPISVQNVITYDVVLAADNPELLLKPGMTATARIITVERRDVLRVPLQALHYTPSATGPAPASGTPAAGARQGRRSRAATTQAGQVWTVVDGKPKAIPVSVGLDDDNDVEITGGGLKAGDKVIVSESRPGAAARPQTQTSPIGAPRIGR
ncbi:MAG: efflux RND transporter periplasmic adaptor subunit [Caulobacteraceae bacterium]